MDNNIFNKEKGITIVALIVTIIVMLILTTITITSIKGGLIKKAHNVVELSNQVSEQTSKMSQDMIEEGLNPDLSVKRWYF